MKQSAVEWLANEIPSIDWENSYWRDRFEEAKEMEEQQKGYCEEEVKSLAFKFYLEMSKKMKVPNYLITGNYTDVEEWFEQLNPIKAYYEQMDKEVHFNRGNLNK
jgi:hypothetical protein